MTGGTIMTDGTGAPGPYTQTPYKLTTTDIESIDQTTISTYTTKLFGARNTAVQTLLIFATTTHLLRAMEIPVFLPTLTVYNLQL